MTERGGPGVYYNNPWDDNYLNNRERYSWLVDGNLTGGFRIGGASSPYLVHVGDGTPTNMGTMGNKGCVAICGRRGGVNMFWHFKRDILRRNGFPIESWWNLSKINPIVVINPIVNMPRLITNTEFNLLSHREQLDALGIPQ